MEPREKLRILSIDGGGIRGVIPLQIIRYIENITRSEIHQLFDLIAGTSTGAILTCALTYQENNSPLPYNRKYSLDFIETLYRDRASEIFPNYKYIIAKLNDANSIFRPKFNPFNLNNILTEFFSESRISSCVKPIFIASFDIHSNKPIFFSSREAYDPQKNIKLKDVCLATTAAPTYFPSHKILYNSENITCIDGGVVMNNPSLGAFIEVLSNSGHTLYKTKNKTLDYSNIHILSLGTGHVNKVINSEKSGNWGKLKWVSPVIDITTNGPVQITDHQLAALFYNNGLFDNYLRINVPIDADKSEMSDSRNHIIDYWVLESQNYVLNNKAMQIKIKLFLRNCGIQIYD